MTQPSKDKLDKKPAGSALLEPVNQIWLEPVALWTVYRQRVNYLDLPLETRIPFMSPFVYKLIGLIILFATVGVASCQTFFAV